jgi:hypothetical protein
MPVRIHPDELPEATPMIISESATHIVVALEPEQGHAGAAPQVHRNAAVRGDVAGRLTASSALPHEGGPGVRSAEGGGGYGR